MLTCVAAECEAENCVKVRFIILADSSAKWPVFPAGLSSRSLRKPRPMGALPRILVIGARKRKKASEVAKTIATAKE